MSASNRGLVVEDLAGQRSVHAVAGNERDAADTSSRDACTFKAVGDDPVVSGADRVGHRHDRVAAVVVGHIAFTDQGVDGGEFWDLAQRFDEHLGTAGLVRRVIGEELLAGHRLTSAGDVGDHVGGHRVDKIEPCHLGVAERGSA